MSGDGWRERFTISISYYMPVPRQYWNWKEGDPWPTALEGRVLAYPTFDEAVAERRWRLMHPDKWLPPEATEMEVSEVLRTVYTMNVHGAGPQPQPHKAISAPQRFSPQLNRGDQ